MSFIDLSICLSNDEFQGPPDLMPKIRYSKHTDKEAVAGLLKPFGDGVTQDDLPDGEAAATEFIDFCTTHDSTHMDAPYHFHSTMNGGVPAWTIDQVPLDWCAGPGVVVDMSDKPTGYMVTPADFIDYFNKINYTLKPGDVVLLHTNARTKWNTPDFWRTGCGVGREGTLWLIDQGVRCVATDAWSWDIPLPLQGETFRKTGDKSVIWEGHKAGREKAYVQIEKVCNLEKLPKFGFRFYAFPIKVKGASAGFVRAVAEINDL